MFLFKKKSFITFVVKLTTESYKPKATEKYVYLLEYDILTICSQLKVEYIYIKMYKQYVMNVYKDTFILLKRNVFSEKKT